MGRRKLTDEANNSNEQDGVERKKAARKAEREKKKAGAIDEVKEEIKDIAENVIETAKEEIEVLEGKASDSNEQDGVASKEKKAEKKTEEKEGFADTDFGIDVFSQQ